MKALKAIGRFAVYILFFGATWVLNLLIVALFSVFFGADAGEAVSDLEILCFLIIPVVASLAETLAFSKKWPRKQSTNNTAPSPAYAQPKGFALHKEPPIEPIIPVRQAETYYSPVKPLDTVETQLYAIDCMEGHEFEFWCADALRKLGYHHVEVTPGSGDQGVDVLAQKDGIKYAVQCKRYSSDLGNKPVQEVHAGKAIYHCHVGVVITNQHFTTGAKELALATDTLLWDRNWIKSFLESQDQYVSSHYSPAPSVELLEDDEMLPAAIDVVVETGQASVSMLQRRLRLGYARCSLLMDQMEEKGIVGPFEGSKPRSILISKQQWQSLRRKYYQ